MPELNELTEAQLEFVTFIHQFYALHGELLTEQLAQDDFNIRKQDFRRYMADELIQNALTERGIELAKFHLDPNSWQSKALTPTQLLVANAMLDITDRRSDKKKLQDLGVSTTQYQSWMKDPVFGDYVRTRAEAMLKENMHEADRALLDKVQQGDIRAIAYLNEFTGRFTPQRGNSTDQNAISNLQSIIVRMVEIITDEVDDLEVAGRIGDRMKSLMTGHVLAGTAIEPDAVLDTPVIAAPREYTPKLKALLESGEGINL